MALALTTGEWISVSLAGLAFVALVVAASQLRLGIVALRRSSQPVVVVHEVRSEISARGGTMVYHVYLENHGLGAAFNVRFSVEVGGTKYSYTFGESVRGARQLVRIGGPVPTTGELRVEASWAAWGVYGAEGGEGPPPKAFWSRYENAFRETRQTTNPADPAEDLKIRRLRRRKLRRLEGEELRVRRKVEAKAGSRLVAELDELRCESEQEGSDESK
jgi:hypothetical protein